MSGAGMQPVGSADPQATRARLVERLAIISGAPPDDDGAPKARRAVKNWEYDCKSMRELIGKFDSLLAPKPPPAEPASEAETPRYVEQDVDRMRRAIDVARIPKGKRAEMRVSINDFRGVRNVDMRLWYVPKGGGEWVPSRKGVAVEAGKLDAVIDAQPSARRHSASAE